MAKKITKVFESYYGDWVGYYLDGVLIHEGHSMNEHEFFPALGFEYEAIDREIGEDAIGFPNKLEDLN